MTPPLDPEVQTELARIGMAISGRQSEVLPNLELVNQAWSERAAIREYLGGLPRWQAELYAVADACSILGIRYRTA